MKDAKPVIPAAVVIEECPVKRNLNDVTADLRWLDDDLEKPMLLLGKSISTNRIVSLLFNPKPTMVCTKQPLKVKKECSFLIDLRQISLEDLRADGNPPYDRYAFFSNTYSKTPRVRTYIFSS